MQKEAYFHEKPCVTRRDETEWVELVEIGANVLVGANVDSIGRALSQISHFNSGQTLYGTSSAAALILQEIVL